VAVSLILSEFLARFVIPLLGGGDVRVGRPFRLRDRKYLLASQGDLGSAELRFLRLRRAIELTNHLDLPDPDPDELALWMGLHNLLVFDHPERDRVWARGTTWRRVEGVTRTLLALPMPRVLGDGLARHLSVDALFRLARIDTIVPTAAGDVVFRGQDPARRRFGFQTLVPPGHRRERVLWFAQTHATEARRLVEDALRASPLTCLLHPQYAPVGWSPLWASIFLQDRGLARAICHAWATEKDWIALGGAVVSGLLGSLPRAFVPATPAPGGSTQASQSNEMKALAGPVVPSEPQDIGAVVGALIHLHFLKVLEFDARLGVALTSRDPHILAFLALPLLLPSLGRVLGTPVADLTDRHPFETGAQRRWSEYIDHLQELVPKSIIENLLTTLLPLIVKRP
jgi:hypothetical protein